MLYIVRTSLHHHNLVQGIVSREGSARKVPLHVANGAHQLFLSGEPTEVIFVLSLVATILYYKSYYLKLTPKTTKHEACRGFLSNIYTITYD